MNKKAFVYNCTHYLVITQRSLCHERHLIYEESWLKIMAAKFSKKDQKLSPHQEANRAGSVYSAS